MHALPSQLVEAMGGRIGVKAGAGMGSIFSFHLPLRVYAAVEPVEVGSPTFLRFAFLMETLCIAYFHARRRSTEPCFHGRRVSASRRDGTFGVRVAARIVRPRCVSRGDGARGNFVRSCDERRWAATRYFLH